MNGLTQVINRWKLSLLMDAPAQNLSFKNNPYKDIVHTEMDAKGNHQMTIAICSLLFQPTRNLIMLQNHIELSICIKRKIKVYSR